MSDADLELLARYARHGAEDAFAEIVRRHVDLVHSAALRQVRSPQLAEEVAQSTFLKLSRHAPKLPSRTILSAWLYEVARREAIDVVRREASRQLREQIASDMNAMNATAAAWAHIEPLLDEAMHALGDSDRAAVLLRYFENKSLREVGAALGTTDEAARKRVSRAIESLREFFAKRGVTVGASGLAVVISANAVQAAPAGLALTISTAAALGGTTFGTATVAGKALVMTTTEKILVVVALAALSAGIYEAHVASTLRAQISKLQEIQAERTLQLSSEREAASIAASEKKDELERLRRDQAELIRLRGEVGMLRQRTNELGKLLEVNRRPQPLMAAEAQAPQQTEVSPIQARQNYAEAWMRAFLAYAKMNQGELPTSFEQAERFWPKEMEKRNDFTTDQFEILYRGSLISLAKDDVIVFREKKLWENPSNGRRGRFSVLAGGRAQYGSVPPGTPDESFSEWEKEHLALTAAQ